MIPAGSQSTARGPAAGRSAPRAAEHPLAEARAEQESSDLNQRLGQLVYQAIIDRIERHGEVHADDLEPYFPAEHADRCRKLVPGQLGSLRGRKFIQPTTEYRKSKVPARKCAKSWVYVFTRLGREQLVGIAAGQGDRTRKESPLEPPTMEASGDPGEQSAPTGDPPSKGADRDPDPSVPSASVQDSPAAECTSDGSVVGETLSLLPGPDPEAWAA